MIKRVQFFFPMLLILFFHQALSQTKMTPGKPLFPGWYADPEATIFQQQYLIYPTYSAPYDKQVFFDAFSIMT